MPETEPDRRLVEDISTPDLIQILGEKLKHHPLHLADPDDLKKKVAEIIPPPESEEPAPLHRVEHIISELRGRMMNLALHAGFDDQRQEVDSDTLLKWESDLYQVCRGLTLVGSRHVLSLMEIYADIKAAKAKMSLMKLISDLFDVKQKAKLRRTLGDVSM